ncbi:MAG: FG-GAP-like repeat-containing protein [Acidobacteria bacterium]|nr:FG-GAP-like repeat-containing protein [Acidobacteriota bacterium]
MTRRELLSLPILLPLASEPMLSAPVATPRYLHDPPYFPYIGLIESGHDEFPRDPVMPPPAPRRDGRFADITGTVLDSEQLSRGIPYWVARLDPALGIDIYGNNGIAVGDIDGDGRDEIYVCQPAGLPNRLFRWKDQHLEEISAAAGVDLLDDTSSALFLDLRNLGRQDLVVLRGSAPVLYLNDGRGQFTLAPDAFRFASDPQGGFTGMAAADFDRDGKLDLYLCCYSFFQSEAQFRYPTPYFDAQNGPPNFLFRNRLNADGTGYLEDVTAAVGLSENNNRYSFAPAWADYDGSGWPSLYVANDFGRSNLYRNQGGKFRDVAAEAGVANLAPGMSACWFDQNGDGRPDLYVANMWTAAGQQVVKSPAFALRDQPAWRTHTKGNSLYRNLGNGKFAEVAGELGLEMGRWGWSADAVDFDNDGQAELLLTCGMLSGHKSPDLMGFFWRQVVARTPATASPNAAYENGWNAINQFIREGYSWNGHEPNVFYVRDGSRYRDASLESGLNFAEDSRAFAVTDFDGDGCLDILLKNRLGPQLRVLQNRCGQGRPRVALRLIGTKSNRDAIGAKVRLDGQTKWITAGSGYLSQHTKTLYLGCAGQVQQIEITWPSGLTQKLEKLDAGALYEVTEGSAARLVRKFAAASPIAPSVLVGDNQPRLHDTWLKDPVPLPMPQTGPGLYVLTEAAAQPHLAAYTLFRRYLFEHRAPLDLPLAFLLNAEGHAVKVYRQVPNAPQVAADLKLINQRPALPYPGRALAPARRDYFKLGASLLWCGYPEQALPYLEAVLRQQPTNVRTMVLVAQVHREAGRIAKAAPLVDEALRLAPGSAEAWNEQGALAMAREDFSHALECFDQALAAKSGLTYALLNAAQAAEKLNRLPLAEDYYRQALTSDPSSPEGHQGLGLTMAKRGQLAEAERELKEAVRLRPAYSAAWNNLGVLYLQQRAPDKAVEAIEQGIAAAPDDELLYLNLGRIYVQQKRLPEARRAMERLLKVRPESQVAQKALKDLTNASQP